MTIKIAGNWHSGLAFDVHTLDSTYLGVDEYGHDRWENTRSDMGQLVYNLKYLGNRKTIPKIVKLLDKIKGIESMDGIIPIPPPTPHAGFNRWSRSRAHWANIAGLRSSKMPYLKYRADRN